MDLEINTLQQLIRIPSVYDAATVAPGRPCGKAVADALEFMKQLALRDGFAVEEYGGHAIAICLGSGAGRIDVVSHLDVVEPGDGWQADPFSGEIRDGRLYGRGSQDMKASAFLTYLALRKIRDEGVPLKRQLRVVLGTDEERTMEDMMYYISKAGLPDFAFTPDGSFPMAIGEKGALMWRLSGSYDGIAEELDCGVQCNVISPVARAVIKPGVDRGLVERTWERLGLRGSLAAEEGRVTVTVHGTAAHASRPEEGHSATVDLLQLLGACGDACMQNLYDCFSDPYGAGIGVASWSEESYTMNLGVFRVEHGVCYGEVDARYPYGMTAQRCTEKLQEHCALKVSLDYDSAPTMNDPEDPFVKTLLSVYQEKTQDFRKPTVSGGVTYSKVFGHCVAYGPIRPGMANLAHQANESIALSDLNDALLIYYEAMKRIGI